MKNASLTLPTKYIHQAPESWSSFLVKLLLRIYNRKNRLQHKLSGPTMPSQPAPIPPKLLQKLHISQDEVQGRQVYKITHPQKKSPKVVLYLHGGAYVNNLIKPHWDLIRALVELTGATFIIPDYPLAPQHQYPAVYAMLDEIYADLSQQVAPYDLVLMGDSAGAALVLGFAQQLVVQQKPQPSQLVLLAPWLDVSMANPAAATLEKTDPMLSIQGLRSAGLAYAGSPEATLLPQVSPLYGQLTGLAPMAIFIGTHDLLWADVQRLRELLDKARTPYRYWEYPKMTHVWMAVTFMPEAQHALREIAQLLNDA